MTDARLELRGVRRLYDGHAVLADVSLSIASGDHTAILGPSGCGKSTLLRLLTGLEAPDAGEVVLDGTVLSGSNRVLTPPHQRGMALVFQDLALWPNLSLLENVLLGLSGTALSRGEARARAAEALSVCGIQSLARRKPGQVSGGEQQRAALARALAVRPRFLLLDEPFAGVDLIAKTRLFSEIAALAAARDLTVVLVSHDPLEAIALCRSAVVLEGGRVQESGALSDLLRDPHSALLKTFQSHLRGTVQDTVTEPATPPAAKDGASG